MYIEPNSKKESINSCKATMGDGIRSMKKGKSQLGATKKKAPRNIRGAHIKLNQQLIMKTFLHCSNQRNWFFSPGASGSQQITTFNLTASGTRSNYFTLISRD